MFIVFQGWVWLKGVHRGEDHHSKDARTKLVNVHTHSKWKKDFTDPKPFHRPLTQRHHQHLYLHLHVHLHPAAPQYLQHPLAAFMVTLTSGSGLPSPAPLTILKHSEMAREKEHIIKPLRLQHPDTNRLNHVAVRLKPHTQFRLCSDSLGKICNCLSVFFLY